MKIDLSIFDYSICEAKKAEVKTVAILGLNELTNSLIEYCGKAGLNVVAILNYNTNNYNVALTPPVIPVKDVKALNPNAILLASLNEQAKLKDMIYKQRC